MPLSHLTQSKCLVSANILSIWKVLMASNMFLQCKPVPKESHTVHFSPLISFVLYNNILPWLMSLICWWDPELFFLKARTSMQVALFFNASHPLSHWRDAKIDQWVRYCYPDPSRTKAPVLSPKTLSVLGWLLARSIIPLRLWNSDYLNQPLFIKSLKCLHIS